MLNRITHGSRSYSRKCLPIPSLCQHHLPTTFKRPSSGFLLSALSPHKGATLNWKEGGKGFCGNAGPLIRFIFPQVRASSLKAIFVFIAPPSLEELERRLRGRGTEDDAQISGRLAAAKEEMDRHTPPHPPWNYSSIEGQAQGEGAIAWLGWGFEAA